MLHVCPVLLQLLLWPACEQPRLHAANQLHECRLRRAPPRAGAPTAARPTLLRMRLCRFSTDSRRVITRASTVNRWVMPARRPETLGEPVSPAGSSSSALRQSGRQNTSLTAAWEGCCGLHGGGSLERPGHGQAAEGGEARGGGLHFQASGSTNQRSTTTQSRMAGRERCHRDPILAMLSTPAPPSLQCMHLGLHIPALVGACMHSPQACWGCGHPLQGLSQQGAPLQPGSILLGALCAIRLFPTNEISSSCAQRNTAYCEPEGAPAPTCARLLPCTTCCASVS